MKVLILINSDVGLYKFRKELILRLRAEGHEIIGLTPLVDCVDQLKETGMTLFDVPVDRRGLNPFHDVLLLKNYYRILRKEQPDMVITYTIKPNVYGGIVCRLLKIPYCGNITGLGTAFESSKTIKTVATMLYRIALKRAKCVFFQNSLNLRFFIDRHIITSQQAVLLNGSGVNLEHFSYQPYPLDHGTVKFLFMGRIMREKGVNELFEAMSRLREMGFDCCLNVLGWYEENYEAEIGKYEQEGWLHYYGCQKDVRPFITESHCFVLPSWHEGMANTNLESAASGRPVITSNIPGCKETVIAGISGYLCKAKDADDLCEQMKKFIELPYEEKRRMGQAGRRHMEQVFDRKNVVAEIIRRLF